MLALLIGLVVLGGVAAGGYWLGARTVGRILSVVMWLCLAGALALLAHVIGTGVLWLLRAWSR